MWVVGGGSTYHSRDESTLIDTTNSSFKTLFEATAVDDTRIHILDGTYHIEEQSGLYLYGKDNIKVYGETGATFKKAEKFSQLKKAN
jgi:hypothetical protein